MREKYNQLRTYIKKHPKQAAAVILIVLAFFITRFYNIQFRLTLGWDHANFLNKMYDISQGNLTLLGPRVNNDLGFYLAPYFEYLMFPVMALAGFHPNGMITILAIANSTLIAAMLYVLTRLFSFKHALFVTALWTLNFIAMKYDTNPWWIIFIPLGTFFTLWMLKKLHEQPHNMTLWLVFGAGQGVFMNMHFQYILMLVFSGIFLFSMWREKQPKITHAAASLGMFALMFTPLLVFDLRNNFLNTTLFINFFFATEPGVQKELLDFVPVLENFIEPYTFVKSEEIVAIFYTIVIGGAGYLAAQTTNFKKLLYGTISVTIMIMIGVFVYYGKRPSEYYFIFSLPLTLLVLVALFLRFKLECLLIGLIIALSIHNAPEFQRKMAVDEKSIPYIEESVQYLRDEIGTEGYQVSYAGNALDAGFGYMLRYYGFDLSDDPQDPLVEIYYPVEDRTITAKIGKYGIYIPPELE